MGIAAGAILALWMAQAAAAALGCALYLRLLRRPQPRPGDAPPVLVAVPVRGGEAGLDRFLAALAAQDYPAWRVVFAVEDRGDPAFAVLERFAAAHPARTVAVVVASATVERAQKVHNLLAALPSLRPDDAALVTLDADTLPPPDMLTELLRPVLTGQGDLSSGYRWTLPASARAGALALSLAEMGVATLPRRASLNLCWGGATAIGRRALERLDLPRLWDRAVSDDLSVSREAHRAGLVIYAPLTARPPSPAEAGIAGAVRFGARQHRLLRLHSPGRWLLAGLLLALPVAGGAVAVALVAVAGSRVALACLAAAWLLGRVRAALRAAIAQRVLPPGAAAEAVRALRRGWWCQPLAHALHAAAWMRSAGGRHLSWAGRRYRLTARGDVRAVARLPAYGGGV